MQKLLHRFLNERLVQLLLSNSYIQAVLGNDRLMEFVRFCIVGGTCAVIDAVIYYTVLFLLPDRGYSILGFYAFSYHIAILCGYLLSLCVNYYLTVTWTFKVHASKKNALGIVVAHMFNLFVVRMGLMWLFITALHISESIAYIPMAIISAVTNYLIVKFAVNKTSEKR